jgi:hypothetical protein
MKYILRRAGSRTFFCCGGYEAPIFSNMLAAWTFSSPEKAYEAAVLMIKHSTVLRLDIYSKPNFSDIGFDESEVANIIKGFDELALKLHPLPYEGVGKLRDASMNARDLLESALLDVGLKLIANATPVAKVVFTA